MVSAAIWAGALLLAWLLFLLRFGKPLAGLTEAQREAKVLDNQRCEVELAERRNKAELDRLTMTEKAEAQKAKLKQDAANSEVAAEVTRQTVADRVSEEQQIIAARAEGRALAAKEKALSSGDPALADAIIRGYETYCKQTSYPDKLVSWLGGQANFDRLVNGSPVLAETRSE